MEPVTYNYRLFQVILVVKVVLKDRLFQYKMSNRFHEFWPQVTSSPNTQWSLKRKKKIGCH